MNPVEALIFFRLLLSNCLNWKIDCDDHSSLSLDRIAEIIVNHIPRFNFVNKLQCFQGFLRRKKLNLERVLVEIFKK